MNGRLDTLQAAILIEKLGIFASEIKSRQEVAAIDIIKYWAIA